MVRDWGLYVVIGWILVLWGQVCLGAEMTARVDRNPISVDESVELLVEIKGTVDGEPDFSALDEDFEILNQQSSSNIRIINGRTSRSVQYQLTLMPRRAGELVIPALRLGKDATAPIPLMVTMPRPGEGRRDTADDLFLEVTVEPEHPYVQAQVLYTVRLYQGISLADGSLSEPEAEDTIVSRLGKDRHFTTTRNGRRYRVTERRYLLHPQKDGPLSIAPLVFQGRVAGRTNSLFDPLGRIGPTKRLRSRAVTLDVQPRPPEAPTPWFPAAAMKISADWSVQPDAIRAGEPLTLTIQLEADGLPANALPEPQLAAVDGVKQYPDQAQFQDRVGPDGILGSLTKKIALVAAQPGTYTLPAIEIPYWNTDSHAAAIATLPERKLVVGPGAETPPAPPAAVGEQEATGSGDQGWEKAEAGKARWYYWPWLSLALGTGWAATLLLWLYSNGRRRTRLKNSGNEAEKEEDRLQRLENRLRRACRNNDPQQARNILSRLTAGKGDAPAPADTALEREAARLDAYLYSRERQEEAWSGLGLWEAWKERKAQGKKTAGSKERLHDLYDAGG